MIDQKEKNVCNDVNGFLPTVNNLIKFSISKNEERLNRRVKDDEAYNIFEILNLVTNEVNGHSRFLHHLLSPRGSHGMGDVFLRAFFKQILKIEPEPWMSRVRVGREVAFEDGRIDILIEYPNKCCVVIEVKIYANDQYRQLKRYSDYIEQWKRKNPDAFVVRELYLTLDGHEASDFSVGESKIEYESVSFVELMPWLEKCIELSRSRVRTSESIKQYLEIVRRLAMRKEMDPELADIVEMVGGSQSTYEAATQIAHSLPFVRTRLLEKIFKDIEKHLESKFTVESNLTTDAERAEVRNYYFRDERRKPYPRLKFKIKEDGDRILALVVELWNRLWIGTVFFKTAENEWGFERIDGEREWLYSLCSTSGSKKWNTMVENAPMGDWWLDWRFKDESPMDEGCIDFKLCLSDEDSQFEYVDLFDPQKYKNFIQLVYSGIDDYCDRLKELGIFN